MLSQLKKIFSIEATYFSKRDKRFLIKHFRFFSVFLRSGNCLQGNNSHEGSFWKPTSSNTVVMARRKMGLVVRVPQQVMAWWGYHFTRRNVGNHTPISTFLQSTGRSSHRPLYQMSFPAEARSMNGFLWVQFSALQNQLFWSLICPFLTQQIWQLWCCAWHQL